MINRWLQNRYGDGSIVNVLVSHKPMGYAMIELWFESILSAHGDNVSLPSLRFSKMGLMRVITLNNDMSSNSLDLILIV